MEDKKAMHLHFLKITAFVGWRIPEMQGHLPEFDLLVPGAPAVLLELVGGLGVNTGLAKVPAGRDRVLALARPLAQPSGYPASKVRAAVNYRPTDLPQAHRSSCTTSASASAVPPQPTPRSAPESWSCGAPCPEHVHGRGSGLPVPTVLNDCILRLLWVWGTEMFTTF